MNRHYNPYREMILRMNPRPTPKPVSQRKKRKAAKNNQGLRTR